MQKLIELDLMGWPVDATKQWSEYGPLVVVAWQPAKPIPVLLVKYLKVAGEVECVAKGGGGVGVDR